MNSLIHNLGHLKKYSIVGLLSLAYNKIYTIIVLPTALLIRRPAYIRSAGSIKLGTEFMAGPGLIIDLMKPESELLIGHNVKMNHRVHIGVVGKVLIGDNVLIGSNVTIMDHSHGVYKGFSQSSAEEMPINRKWHVLPVVIGSGVWICDNVVITEGVNVGDNSVIGANSVVKKSIPSGVIAVGNPAKVVKKWDAYSKTWLNI